MEAIKYLEKHPGKWFTTTELIEIEKSNRENVLSKLQRIYNSTWKEIYGLVRDHNRNRTKEGYSWMITKHL